MVNASLNWSSIVGLILAIWGLISAPLAIAQDTDVPPSKEFTHSLSYS